MKGISATAALVLFLTIVSPSAHADLLTEDQAAQLLGTAIAADQPPPPTGLTKQNLDNANGTVCGKDTIESRNVAWCIQPTDRTKNPFVIYFFHGLTMDEHRWQEADFATDLQARWKAQGLTPPTVVSVSFGPVWLLTQTRDKKYDFFISTLMPYFENLIGPVTSAQRIAMGESMGGFNVSQLFLKAPQMFSRFVMQCPAITEVGPFDAGSKLLAFIKRTGADPKRAVLTKLIGMYEFETEPEWLAHSPLDLATNANSFPTKVYLSCGNDDHFGFYEGVDALSKILIDKTQYLQYVFIPGGQHGTVDVPSMADFVSADWKSAPTLP